MQTPCWCSRQENGFRLAVHITPNAKKSVVIGIVDDALKIKLQAQPIDGKANAALTIYVARLLDLPKSAVVITHGLTAKRKLLEITAPGLALDRFQSLLLAGVAPP